MNIRRVLNAGEVSCSETPGNIGNYTNCGLYGVNIGGIVGELKSAVNFSADSSEFPFGGSVTNSYNKGKIRGRSKVGGLIGMSYGVVLNSQSSGDVDG